MKRQQQAQDALFADVPLTREVWESLTTAFNDARAFYESFDDFHRKE